MKIWKWYRNLSEEEFEAARDDAIEDKYPLYAFTDDKEIRDLWRKMRDKDKFIEIKSSISKEDYVVYTNNNRGALLEFHEYSKFMGYDKDPEDRFVSVKILSTWSEKENVQSMLESTFDRNSPACTVEYPFPPMAFIDKYFKALYTLQFVAHWKVYGVETVPEYQEEMLSEMGVELDYSYPDVEFDEFSAFVLLYSEYLKI